MNNRIHFPLAKLAATELLEGLVALQHDQKHAIIHRETIEQQFTDLARELGYAVWPVGEEAPVASAEPAMFRARQGLDASTGVPV
jgi:hypothetical protein